jgi:hypothetical protein
VLAINYRKEGNMEIAEIVAVVAIGIAWVATQFTKKK